MGSERTCDVLIAGQGAGGYAAALYAARYRLDALLVGAVFGGETATGGRIENYPGVPEVDGFDLMLQFREQVKRYHDDVAIVDANVTAITREHDCFRSELADGSVVRSAAVILAVGRERRALGLAHEQEWTGRGISYCSTCDAPLSAGNVVAVVGGGNAAAEGALLNSRYAERVYLIHRGVRLQRPDPIVLEQIDAAPNIEVVLDTQVVELLGSSDGLAAIRLSRPRDGQETVEIHNLFVEIGAQPRSALARGLGAKIDEETGEVRVDRMMRTNVNGLFAAGDLTNGSGSLKQTVTAAAQGAIAAASAYEFLPPGGQRCTKHERVIPSTGTPDIATVAAEVSA